ncbi:hypothetical protein Ddye_023163 [Dipteronia dyeriana]|uniref:Uncharacterized protein n=1 Tax=Dipteronia dyeriana TaxID=168575 RepID=A0AAD9WT48_9ROSI|nr:hypothetical protein Ddye_023163 [Dipteronia dyeriana]
MCLTAHFVDSNWKLQKKILNFCPISSHKGNTIGKALETCLKSRGIERVLTVTADNARSNNDAILYLSKIVYSWNGAIMNADHMLLRCSAHILNLIVIEGLKDYHESISKIHNVVRYVRGSPARLYKFKSCAEREKISSKKPLYLDVPTRWNSTYLMLESAEKFQKAFERLEDHDTQYFLDFCLAVDSIHTTNDMSAEDGEIDADSLFDSGYMKLVKENDGVDNKTEVDQYLMESCENPNDENFDILC